MSFYPFTIGLVLGGFIVYIFRATKLERKGWSYPILLCTFPLFYLAFAAFVSDWQALYKELIVSVVFFGCAFYAFKLNSKIGIYFLAFSYFLHAIYDLAHKHLFINSGVPNWWPVFCAVVDIAIGIYILFLAKLLGGKNVA